MSIHLSIAPAQDLDEEPPEFLPGLIAEVRADGHALRSLEADIWLDETQLDATSTPLVNDNRSVTWSGYLWARENGPFQLHLFAAGRVKVSLAGKQLLDTTSEQAQWLDSLPIELSFGYYPLQIDFEPTSGAARLGVYWSGPSFSLEPIGSQYLFHAATAPPPQPWQIGQTLSRGLRCAACHDAGAQQSQQAVVANRPSAQSLAAPALTALRGNVHPAWLIKQLTRPAPQLPQAEDELPAAEAPTTDLPTTAAAMEVWTDIHLPAYQLEAAEANDIVAALWQAAPAPTRGEPLEAQLQQANRQRRDKSPELRTVGDATAGQLALVSIGCLACHQVGDLGRPNNLAEQLFGGGDLSTIASKRTKAFFRQWLNDPKQINPNHRMPQFDLSLLEQLDLATYLSSLGNEPDQQAHSEQSAEETKPEPIDQSQDASAWPGNAERGAKLIAALRCGACHQLPEKLVSPLVKIPLSPTSHWDQGCLAEAKPVLRRPGFALSVPQRDTLREHWTVSTPWIHQSQNGPSELREHNCTACHARDGQPGIKRQLSDIVAVVPAVAPRLAALSPPSLTAIGDKLNDQALQAAITRRAPLLRPWLEVRMPRFEFSESDLQALAQSLISHDRIPVISRPAHVAEQDHRPPADDPLSDATNRLAAARLVTAEGFGCQSCHAIGAVEAPQVDLNARGTNLAMLGERVRPSWFQRWVRNPARMVPRMEMPAIQTPVHGVLHDSLDLQLDALWSTLNTPGFTPPRPGPVRVLRTHNDRKLAERAWLLTDVLETPDKTYIRPLVFGLPNRQNFLFDLESGQLAGWWLGDMARQHTRGKTWFWEPGSSLRTPPQAALERISLVDGEGRIWEPTVLGQIAAHFDSSQHRDGAIVWQGRLHMSPRANVQAGATEAEPLAVRWLNIQQTFQALEFGSNATSSCTTRLTGLQPGDRVQCSSSAHATADARKSDDLWTIELQTGDTRIEVSSRTAIESSGAQRWEFARPTSSQPAEGLELQWTSTYRSLVPTDQFPRLQVAELPFKPQELDVVPGYKAIQLPLPPSEMPISFAWDDAGDCFVGSLKGRVVKLLDGDGDGLAERYELISDELPTPFGLWAGPEGIDALAKFGLVRLTPSRTAGEPYDAAMVADGWGSTADYHDWAVGLERDAAGNYYMALPCQQDDRSEAAAYLRGTALKLIPLEGTQEPRRYRLETLAAGLRFPMGLALSSQGELFASDNQGNYNPFNEINHLRPGKRYGFINKLENRDGFSPPFESPAINLPHPWTRSVNGLCFLDTPADLRGDGPLFGPFEGHLIGCEMNGQLLVRMSLQKVGDTYQGAAYLFSRPPSESSHKTSGAPTSGAPTTRETTPSEEKAQIGFEGPIVCEVSPAGELYVGNLRDSGWGGGQNTGSIVRLTPSGELPLGIAEMRATSTGFEVDFTQAVDAEQATKISNYQLRSYQRVSTPAYGGDDQDQRHESITSVQLSNDRRRVTLELASLRAGFVYELNIAPLAVDGVALFPSQAHYSMRSLPQ